MLSAYRSYRDFPASLAAGDSWAWTVTFSEAVTVGSTLIYSFRVSNTLVTATGTRAADGLSFAFSIEPVDTAKLPPGICLFSARLVVGASVQTIRNGRLKVTPNLADAESETRTQAEIDLASVQATLREVRRRANGTYSSPGGASYTVADMAKLREEERELRRQVNAEQGRNGAVTIRTAFVCRSWDGWDQRF